MTTQDQILKSVLSTGKLVVGYKEPMKRGDLIKVTDADGMFIGLAVIGNELDRAGVIGWIMETGRDPVAVMADLDRQGKQFYYEIEAVQEPEK